MSGDDDSGTNSGVSGRPSSGETFALREAGAWNPRRSLVARLLWYVVPVALIPAAVYWVAADRMKIGGQTLLVAMRRLPDLRWTYAKVAAQIEPIFAETLRRRNDTGSRRRPLS
ncbi:MAG: hypothetical protein ACXVID_05270 [Thermoanaerobaculia bacterium]